ncbi:MAG: hypothetical protein CMJ18_20845 [Phycisphaeraceae bacterium]|nr:hypothetical protein [Phycisphaeraceae bacterium]
MARLDRAVPVALRGTVLEARGLAVHVVGLPVPVGATITIETASGARLAGEVVGFDADRTIVMPIGATAGGRRGDGVVAEQFAQRVGVGASMLGRVLNGAGQPIDQRGPIRDTVHRPLTPDPIDPLDRPLIDEPLATGIRAIDAMASVGRGQRLGVFAEPGVGKSVLLGMMARGTAADVNVIALVGERGREVNAFIERELTREGLARSVVVCAAGDEPAILRLRAALLATTIAEWFRDQGQDVLLIMDSVTRFCHAQRQIGLAAGEPPATRGYPPSTFAVLSRLLERSGRTRRGSITGFYAVLTEGDPEDAGDDPVTDAVRGILDGHILLGRRLAQQGRWPAIDVINSISRVSDDVIDADHRAAARFIRQIISAHREVEELVNIQAYVKGANPAADTGIDGAEAIGTLLLQGRNESDVSNFTKTRDLTVALARQLAEHMEQLRRQASE